MSPVENRDRVPCATIHSNSERGASPSVRWAVSRARRSSGVEGMSMSEGIKTKLQLPGFSTPLSYALVDFFRTHDPIGFSIGKPVGDTLDQTLALLNFLMSLWM